MNRLTGVLLWLIATLLIAVEYITTCMYLLISATMGKIGDIQKPVNPELVVLAAIAFILGIYFFIKKDKK